MSQYLAQSGSDSFYIPMHDPGLETLASLPNGISPRLPFVSVLCQPALSSGCPWCCLRSVSCSRLVKSMYLPAREPLRGRRGGAELASRSQRCVSAAECICKARTQDRRQHDRRRGGEGANSAFGDSATLGDRHSTKGNEGTPSYMNQNFRNKKPIVRGGNIGPTEPGQDTPAGLRTRRRNPAAVVNHGGWGRSRVGPETRASLLHLEIESACSKCFKGHTWPH